MKTLLGRTLLVSCLLFALAAGAEEKKVKFSNKQVKGPILGPEWGNAIGVI